MNLGQLILALETSCPSNYEVRLHFDNYNNPHSHTVMDWEGAYPSRLSSYRGYYEYLRIGISGPYNEPMQTVKQLLAECRDAVGTTFFGYKGGEYLMTEKTEVYIDYYGEANGWYLSHVELSSETPNALLLVARQEP